MADNGHVEAVRAAVVALNSGDPEGYLQAFTPTSLRWVPGIEPPFPLVDIAENVEQLLAVFTGFVLGEELLFGAGRHVCARGGCSARTRASTWGSRRRDERFRSSSARCTSSTPMWAAG